MYKTDPDAWFPVEPLPAFYEFWNFDSEKNLFQIVRYDEGQKVVLVEAPTRTECIRLKYSIDINPQIVGE